MSFLSLRSIQASLMAGLASTAVTLLSASPAHAANPTLCTSTAEGACDGHMTLSDGAKIEYYRNYPIRANTAVTQAVIVVHGISRDVRDSYEAVVDAAVADGEMSNTLIIAPFFKETTTDSDELFWSNSRWNSGDRDRSRFRRSSFEVMDEIVAKLDSSNFPNLRRVVVAGHSAGGQFVNRYAAGGEAENSVGFDMRYVIANPSSYMYFNTMRPDTSSPWSFANGDTLAGSEEPSCVFECQGDRLRCISSGRSIATCNGQYFACIDRCPENPNECGEYNDYKYGLEDRNNYMRRTSSVDLIEQFQSREIVLLLGTADTGSAKLDMSCEANLQGSNRIDRGRWYVHYLDRYFDMEQFTSHEIAGVGHSNDRMFGSSAGITALFD